MQNTPKIDSIVANKSRVIKVVFENGQSGEFNFEDYYDYVGYFSFLSDLAFFTNLQLAKSKNYAYWLNSAQVEIELDTPILYAICTKQKIIIDGNTVFDPSLGKKAWSQSA